MTRIENNPSPSKTEGVAVDMLLSRVFAGADLAGLRVETLDLLHEAAMTAADTLLSLLNQPRVVQNEQASDILVEAVESAYGFATRVYDEALRRTAPADREYRTRVVLRDAVECHCDQESLRRAADALGIAALIGGAN